MARTHNGHKLRVTAALLFVTLFLSGCPKKGTATADCKSLERYQSSFGFLNAPQLALGSVVDVNLDSKTAGQILTIVPKPSDYNETPPVDSTEIISNADFTLTFDVKLPTAAEGQVRTVVQNSSHFFLANHRRRQVTDPLSLLSADQASSTRIKTFLQSNPTHRLLIIAGIVLADQTQFRLKNNYDASAKANIIKFGNYSIQVKYSCEGTLQQFGKQAGLFFKPLMIQIDGAGNLRVVALNFDLKDIDFNPAIRVL